MSLPDWNTHSAFLTEGSATFATAPELSIDGMYRFYAEAHPDNVERLALNVNVRTHDDRAHSIRRLLTALLRSATM